MDSHEYARVLQQTAEKLLSRDQVEFLHEPILFMSFWEKDEFIKAARAMGSGKKEFKHDDLHFTPEGTCITFTIGRDKVCKKIQEAKWECEPLLSEKEVEDLGVNVSVPTEDDIPF